MVLSGGEDGILVFVVVIVVMMGDIKCLVT